MADNNKKDSGGSFLKTAAAVAPLGIGTGIAIKRMVAGREVQITSPTPAASQAMYAARHFTVPGLKDQFQGSVSWLQKEEELLRGRDAEAARHAWIQAARFTDKKAAAAFKDFTVGIETMEAKNVYDAIFQTVKQNQSQAMLSTFRRFRSNLDVVAQHMSVMGGQAPSMVEALYAGTPAQQVAITDLPTFMQKNLTELSSHLQLVGQPEMYTREEFAGFKSYMLRMTGYKGENISMLLPETKDGLLLEGTSMRTRYIAPDIAIYDEQAKRITQRMSRSEFFMEEFKRTILPAMESGRLTTQADIDRAMRELRGTVFHELETVTNIPDTIEAASQRRYQHTKGQAVDIKVLRNVGGNIPAEYSFSSAFRGPTEVEYSEALRHGLPDGKPLVGGVSPKNIAAGRAGLFNWASTQMVPEATEWGRRPEQLGRLFGLSPAARQAGQRHSALDIFNTPEMKQVWGMEGLPSHFRTAYVNPKQYAEAMERAGIGEGEALAKASLAPALEQQTVRHVHLKTIEKEAMAMIQAGRGAELKPGQQIGQTITGEAFTAADVGRQRILGFTSGESKSMGDVHTLQLLETYRVGEHSKFFGDLKATVRFARERIFRTAAKALGLHEGVQVIASMDELRKNQSLHNKQMVTSLWDMINRTFQKAGAPPAAGPLREFLADPIAMARQWGQASVKEGVYRHEAFIQQAMNFAVKEADLMPAQFGSVFAAVPVALDNEAMVKQMTQTAFEGAGVSPQYILSRGEAGGGPMRLTMSREAADAFQENWLRGQRIKESMEAMNKGIAGGAAQIFYDLPSYGGMGSVEPRAFEQLSAGSTGTLGQEFADEIAQRLRVTQPEIFRTHEALMRSLASFEGKDLPSKESRIWDLSTKEYNKVAFQEWIEQGGGYLRTGKGFSDVYVPGAADLAVMQPYPLPSGNRVKGYLAEVYHQVAARGARMHLEFGSIGPDSMRGARDQAIAALAEHAAPGGKGMGGYLRGPLLGSQYLRNVSQIGGYKPAVATEVGVHISRIREMVDELMRSGLYNQDELQAMLEKARRGEQIGGWGWRQPEIGAFSHQPFMIQPLFGEASDAVATAELNAKVQFRIGSTGETFDKMIKLGPNIGWGADKDADSIAISLVSPDHEKRIAKSLADADNVYTNRYMQHQVRMSLLGTKKVKPLDSLISIEEKMIANTRKLGVTQEYVPKLSIALTEARQAVLAHTEGTRRADAQFLLEWMEQTPISAKHVSAKDITKLSEMLKALEYGLGTENAETLEAQVRKVISTDKTSSRMLQDDLFITNSEVLSKFMKVRGDKIQALDLPETTRTIARALKQQRDTGAQTTAEMIAGRQRVTSSKLPTFLKAIGQAGEGFSGISKGLQASDNLLGAAGRGILKHYKPLALGFAAALGVATALSSPSDTIGPGKTLDTPDPKMNISKGSKRVTAVHPPSPSVGQPTVPPMLHQNSATIAPPARNEMLSIRARVGNNRQLDNLTSQMGRMTGGAKSVNVSVRDHRSSANQYVAANKMFR